jgi:hypothetical protein
MRACGVLEGDVRDGSIATGSSEQQFRPCPLCPGSGSKLAAVICLCGLMVTHLTSFPRSSLSKGGKVPIGKFSADSV